MTHVSQKNGPFSSLAVRQISEWVIFIYLKNLVKDLMKPEMKPSLLVVMIKWRPWGRNFKNTFSFYEDIAADSVRNCAFINPNRFDMENARSIIALWRLKKSWRLRGSRALGQNHSSRHGHRPIEQIPGIQARLLSLSFSGSSAPIRANLMGGCAQ